MSTWHTKHALARRVPAGARPAARRLWLSARRAAGLFVRINPRPIFLLGNQKSGTTAIAALLAQTASCSVTLDLDAEVHAPVFHRVRPGELSISDLIRRNRFDFSRRIIKEPNLTLLLPQLLERFEASKFVFIVRDPRDNIRSILQRLGLSIGEAAREGPAPDHLPDVWRIVLDGLDLERPRPSVLERLAERWCAMAELQARHEDRLVLFRYEDFLAAKQKTIESLARALDLPVRRSIAGETDLPYQPPGDRSEAWPAFFGDEALQTIHEICRPAMTRLGYVIP